MRRRILDYRKRIDLLLSGKGSSDGIEGGQIDWNAVLSEHLKQIEFFQHERLIHLIVTMTVALLTLISLGIGVLGASPSGLILTVMFMILLVPYILHYYLLENEVQKLYEQYDEILKRLNS